MDNDKTTVALKVEHLKKQYRYGYIGALTLVGDIQAWWAKLHKKESPNTIVGTENQPRNNAYFYAVDGVCFDVRQGEALGVLGTNGAGKSTLLKLITRITAPTEGTIAYNGRIASMLEVGTGFHDELTGRENIFMNGAILGMTHEEVVEKIEEIIEFSECRKFIDTPLKRYSSGMRIKLGFAVAAHLNNEILIMDEVLAVGDLRFQRKCIKKMREISENSGRTILYVSHNMSTIRDLCSRCIVLEKGKLIYDGDVEAAIEIYSESLGMASEVHMELSGRKRPVGHHLFDGSVKIQSATMVDKSSASYFSDEKMRLKINCVANKNVKDVAFYCVAKYQGEVPAGTMLSDKTAMFIEGENSSLIYLLDLSGFAPGRYAMDFYFSAIEGGKTVLNYDVVTQALSFEVLTSEKEEKIRLNESWNHAALGSIKLPAIQLETTKKNI